MALLAALLVKTPSQAARCCAQVESAISQEVSERSADLVEAAGDLGHLKRVVRQLHFQIQLAQRQMATLEQQSGAEAGTVQRLRRRRERIAALHEVRAPHYLAELHGHNTRPIVRARARTG